MQQLDLAGTRVILDRGKAGGREERREGGRNCAGVGRLGGQPAMQRPWFCTCYTRAGGSSVRGMEKQGAMSLSDSVIQGLPSEPGTALGGGRSITNNSHNTKLFANQPASREQVKGSLYSIQLFAAPQTGTTGCNVIAHKSIRGGTM